MRPVEPPPVDEVVGLGLLEEDFVGSSFGLGEGIRKRWPIESIAVEESPFALASSLVVRPLRFATAERESPAFTV